MVKGIPTRVAARWWLPEPGRPPSHPVFDPCLLALRSRALDLAFTAGLLLVVVLSRVIAFPAGIWEQDEAYLSAGVLQFLPAANHPHPPWFPLWIATGKLVHLTGLDAATGLRLVASAASVWMLFPLASLAGRVVRRELAVAAAVLALLLPGPWLLAGRAFSETPATALLLLTAALWAGEREGARGLVPGSIAAGACLLVRPQLLLPVAGMAAVVIVRRRGRGAAALLAPMAAVLAAGYAAVAFAAGGVAPLRAALAAHAGIHFGSMDRSTYAFAASGLARCLVSPVLGAIWLGATALGLGAMWRRRATLGAAPALLTTALLGLCVTIWGLSNPAHPRYTIPFLAMSAAPVAVALAAVLRRWVLVLVGGAVAASAWTVLPALRTYTRSPSPPVAAVQAAIAEAARRAAVVVADPTLVAFVELERVAHGIPVTVLYADQIASGQSPPPPPFATVAVWDDDHHALVAHPGVESAFTCAEPLLRRLAQDRFLDLTVGSGATLRAAPTRHGPDRGGA